VEAVPVEVDALLRDAEEQIESWWCRLDEAWHVRLAEADAIVTAARVEADRILTDAIARAEALRPVPLPPKKKRFRWLRRRGRAKAAGESAELREAIPVTGAVAVR